uniref:Uncharacterized protein n=1 Tax=Cannabis sativa TaxID=3483 RepID=A0A803PPR1_CANSA
MHAKIICMRAQDLSSTMHSHPSSFSETGCVGPVRETGAVRARRRTLTRFQFLQAPLVATVSHGLEGSILPLLRLHVCANIWT